MVFSTMEQNSCLIILNMENEMLDAVELLDSYEKSAKAAILDVTDETIGAGDDPISFIICAFRSQADKIKELKRKLDYAVAASDTADQKIIELTGKRKPRSIHTVSKAEVRRLVPQTTKLKHFVVYGPTEEDGGNFVYWGGKCRGKLMPEYADSK